MILKNSVKTLTTSTALLSGLFLITGCSSSDDGSSAASVPANAVTITEANAESTVQSASSSSTTLNSTLGVETTQSISLKGAINMIKPLLDINSANIAAGVNFSEPCLDGGSISGSATESNDGTTYSENGAISFNNCIESGSIFNGTVNFSSTTNYSTGAYTDNFSGALNMSFNGGNEVINFNGLIYSETGNNQTATYTVNKLTYSLNFTTNGTTGGGYLVTLTAPIVESNGDFCPESGHITITGANGTTAEGIYNGDGTLTIKANGTVVNSTAFCYN